MMNMTKESKVKGKCWLPRRLYRDYNVQRIFKDDRVVKRHGSRKSVKLKDVPKKDVMDMLVGVDRAWYT